MIFLLGCTPETEFSGNSEHAIVNHGFESFAESLDGWYSVEGWHGKEGGISNDRYFTPVEGAFFAALKSSDNWISQQLDISVEAGKTYTLTAWARSINQAGNGAATIAEIGMFANGEVVTSVKEEVGVQELKGVAALVQNDDGANVWIDGNYRHQFADIHMFQTIDSDPIVDPWVEMENSNYLTLNGLGWAVGNVIAGDQKYIYGTIYKDNRDDFYSSITMTKVTGEVGSNYTWADPIHIPWQFHNSVSQIWDKWNMRF